MEKVGLEASIYVAVNTLEYLKKSGRVTAAGAAIGTILNIKPVLQIQGAFNDNMLRPGPMLENPEKLRKIFAETGAHSTDMQSPESAEHLCAKCDAYAENWVGTADRLWECSCKRKGEKKQ